MTIDVEHEMSRLRDFQRTTADYAYARLFADGERATSRFLVADEVGLGKTMVARGVIAHVIDHLQQTGDDRVDVVYICSNGAIAAQNLRKLAPAGVPVEHRTERLPLLAFRLSQRTHSPINLIALTPGTALAQGHSTGRVEERAAVLAALRQLWGGHRLRGEGLHRIFAGDIGPGWHDSPTSRIRYEASCVGQLSPEALRHFGEQVARVDAARDAQGLADVDTALHHLGQRIGRTGNLGAHIRQERNELIGQLREALATTGAHLLQPDLVVLDEFQRFRDVLQHGPDSGYAADIAQHLFNFDHTEFNRRTRVLMLSATPYVMHTTRAESAADGEEHYADFLATFRFLADGLPGCDAEAETTRLREDLAIMRTALADVASHGITPVHAATDAVSTRLRQVMVRTERLAATPDRNGMLRTVAPPLSVPSSESLTQYAATARVADHVASRTHGSHGDVVEYWKAAPYTLSYLGAHGYQLAERLRELVGPNADRVDSELLRELTDSPATLPWDAIRQYAPLPAAHAGLERLWQDFFDDAEAHRLLWLPPAIPYYRAGGSFETPAARRMTKRLIFSAWTLVPTAIATLTTYEAERRLRQAAEAAGGTVYAYDDDRRYTQRLRFGADTQSMASLQFLVPSPALARLGDPLTEAVHLRTGDAPPTWEAIRSTVRARVAAAVHPLVQDLPRGRGAGATSWYTLAPLLLDGDHARPVHSLLHRDGEDSTGLDRHATELDRLLHLARTDPTSDELPPVPPDLVDILTLTALAGPPAVMYRAVARLFPGAPEAALVSAAATAAEGFRSLINSPETYRIIDSEPGEEEFWQKLLTYCARGNLQAVMDEYLALLVENRGYDRIPDVETALSDAAADLRDVLSMRAASYRPAVVTADGEDTEPRWRQIRMRGRFAMRYGSDSTEEGDEKRAGDVGLAFNSPFWPFVLATTSVGQEGLDFHQYCHAVTHWNLPGNPVDLEQREGRVHRYKGHAVRKNVGRTVPPPDGTAPPWQQAFAAAGDGATDESGMVPYWVYAPASLNGEGAAIERHLPLVPYTRERSVIGPLLSSVAHYRLAFGQPRQDELVLTVLDETDDAVREQLGTVRIDLSPPARSRTGGLPRESGD